MTRFTVLKSFLIEISPEQIEAQETLKNLLIAEGVEIAEEDLDD